MALFPITGRFVGDFVPHLVPVDTDDDMDAVAQKVAVHSVGRRVPVREGVAYDVFVDGKKIPTETKLGELNLLPLQWLDVCWRS
jgi:toluene monooxygenase system protein B